MSETYEKKNDNVLTTENLAKDIETPKLKRIDIPDAARAEINRMNERLEIYLSGVVIGMGIKGKWNYDAQRMQIIVEATNGKNKT